MSPRTAKYVDAMIREGDNFDYDEWLKRVREEDAPAKQLVATRTSDELGAAQINKPISSSTSDRQHDRPISPLELSVLYRNEAQVRLRTMRDDIIREFKESGIAPERELDHSKIGGPSIEAIETAFKDFI
jgi:hypothetical protein